MKKFLIVLLGLIGAYLLIAGGYNAWNFLSGLEPVDVIGRLSFFALAFAACAFLAWAILTAFFDMD